MKTSSMSRRPSSLMWLCGGALAVNLLLVIGLLGMLAYYGLGYFWQKELTLYTMEDGSKVLAELYETREVRTEQEDGSVDVRNTLRVKTGNRDVYALDFRFLEESEIVSEETPVEAIVLERSEDGNFYGLLKELRRGDEVMATSAEDMWPMLDGWLVWKAEQQATIDALDEGEIADVSKRLEALRLERRALGADGDDGTRAAIDAEIETLIERDTQLSDRLFRLRASMEEERLVVETIDGVERELPASDVVRAFRPNQLSLGGRIGLYFDRVGEFLWDDPRNSNTEGGIFPAIFGTVMMVFLMSIFAVPLGVVAALYLREYARQGMAVRLVRIAVNNLAGVPSIVFGVFGLGFFVYGIGGTIDELFYSEALPTPTFGTGGILWGSLTLALLTVPVVIVATEEGLAAVPRAIREGSLALGATKFETTWRVILPAAAPGIMTGAILAVARAAGEVAPLMIVGMVKLADVPVSSDFPFVHFEQKFMHLGFHIYDLGFQSPNVEAARPLVFATAFLLVGLVVAMNLVATIIRSHLRRKYSSTSI